MKKKEFDTELEERLLENRMLWENPGLGSRAGSLISFIGLNFFWAMLVLSFLMTVLWTRSELVGVFDRMFFGFLFGGSG